MSLLTESIYESSNGDSWTLVRDTESGQMVVRHEPNQASGGHTSEIDVAAFLRRGGAGPEHAALRKLLAR
jgi:hypothetical protein